jgi:tetratricopeptide (TPR) repeat protein
MIYRWHLLLFFTVLLPLSAVAASDTGKIHGHSQDPAKNVLTGVKVVLSTDAERKDIKYSFSVDDKGDYKGDAIAAGSYYVTLYSKDDKPIDQFANVKIVGGQDTTQDFDLSRQEFIARLSKEQIKAIEDYAAANKENAAIKDLNATLQEARKANAKEKYKKAEALMTKATLSRSDIALLWIELGVSQIGLKKYGAAIVTLRKAYDVESAAKKPDPEVQAEAYNALGQALAAKGQIAESQATFESAAKLVPNKAAAYYGNEAIMMDRLGRANETVAAANKAIAANPKLAVAYYLKGKALGRKITMDPKTHENIIPKGCEEAFQKYLELEPKGRFAPEVRTFLQQLHETPKARR